MRVVFLSVLMMVSVVAEAKWTLVALSDGGRSGISMFLDFSTLKRTNEGYFRIWKMSNSDKLEKGDSFRSEKSLMVFDCAQERSRSLSRSYFDGEMGQGMVISNADGDDKWSFPSPESMLWIVMKAVCQRR